MSRPTVTPAAADAAFIRDSRRSRPLYFEGQFLTARDLNTEQEYLLARQADFARALGFGVVDGLRVERLEKSQPNEQGVLTKLRVAPGTGITPAGEILRVPLELIVDLTEIELMRELNARFGLSREPQQPFVNLDGLFVFGLRQVEFTANPVPVFPASLDGRDVLHDGETVEAAAFTLVPYASPAANEARPAEVLSHVAREIFLDGKPPTAPGGVLPLAMLLLRGGEIKWVDEYLVRREAGDDDRFGFGFAPRALAEAHFHHYRARVTSDELPLDAAGTAATDHFEVLPPGGPLPLGVVNAGQFTQTFFPPDARVDIVLVPADELPALMDESLDLPPVDLRLKPEDNDALAFLVLAPVKRADFDGTLESIEARPLPPGLTQRPRYALPNSLLNALNSRAPGGRAEMDPARLTIAKPSDPFADAKWTKLLKGITEFWYVRRRNLPPPGQLAGTLHPATAAPPPGIGTDGDVEPADHGDIKTEFKQVVTEDEAPTLLKTLADEGLTGGYLSLRLAAGVKEHAALAGSLSALLDQPRILLHEAVERLLAFLKFDPDTPDKNYEFVKNSKNKELLSLAAIRDNHVAVSAPGFLAGLEKMLGPAALNDPAVTEPLARSGKLADLAKLATAPAATPAAVEKLRVKLLEHARRRRPSDIKTTVAKFAAAVAKGGPK
jgi:hypothetical protein